MLTINLFCLFLVIWGGEKLSSRSLFDFYASFESSADQARSFASYMHNEDNLLQYFAVDFHGEVMGLHGSGILQKAAFVNVAVRTIISLYQAQGFLTGISFLILPFFQHLTFSCFDRGYTCDIIGSFLWWLLGENECCPQ